VPAHDDQHAISVRQLADRLGAIIDVELTRLQEQAQAEGSLDWGQLQKLARAIREFTLLAMELDQGAGALPRAPSRRNGGTTDTLAGKLLAASEANGASTQRPSA
jgi:hypothetical protein